MTIELTAELERKIEESADAQGIPLSTYVELALADTLEREKVMAARRSESSREFLDRLEKMAPPVQTLQDSTFDREMIYGDDLEKFTF